MRGLVKFLALSTIIVLFAAICVACSFYSFAAFWFHFREFLKCFISVPIPAVSLPMLAQNRACLIEKVQLINAFYRCCVDAKDASLSRKLREQALRKPPENKEKETTNQKNFI